MAKKKKSEPGYAICGQCAEVIDLDKLYAAQKADRTFVHYCGRVLNWGGNPEVPPDSFHAVDTDAKSNRRKSDE